MKEKNQMHNLDFNKMLNICCLKDTVKRIKILPINWEEIFSRHISDKRLALEIYKDM